MTIDRDSFKNKLLFFDIETSLLEVYTHSIGSKVPLGHKQIKVDKKIICIAYKAEGMKTCKVLTWNNKTHDDREMLKEFTKIAQQYPVLVGQNGDNFDVKVIKGRLWIEQLPPLTNLVTLDTLKFSRNNFKLTSHRLDYMSKVQGCQGKIHMDIDDWINVQENKPGGLEKMVKYNKVDVDELQNVFWSMLAYCDKLPFNMSVLLRDDRNGCPKCGSKHYHKDGLRPSTTGHKQRFRCNKCGGCWADSRALSTLRKEGII